MNTFRFLNLATHVRENHVAQPQAPLLPPRPTPEPRPASEWAFISPVPKQSAVETDSESSQSLSSDSSDSSEDTILPPHRPSSPHCPLPDNKEIEASPPFVSIQIKDSDFETHCTRHCKHIVCAQTDYFDKKSGIKHICTCVPRPASHTDISLAQLDISTAKRSYQDAPRDKKIVICLSVALEIIKHLRNKGELDLWHFLLKSPLYTKSTISKPTQHAAAAKSANYMVVGGIDCTLATMLYLPNSGSCVISVRELDDVLEACLRWDCLFWMQRWIGDEGRELTLNSLNAEIETNRGLEVLVEKAREYMKDVVGALVWWDAERRMEVEMREARNSAISLVLTHTARTA
jgi:hypothetical protein